MFLQSGSTIENTCHLPTRRTSVPASQSFQHKLDKEIPHFGNIGVARSYVLVIHEYVWHIEWHTETYIHMNMYVCLWQWPTPDTSEKCVRNPVANSYTTNSPYCKILPSSYPQGSNLHYYIECKCIIWSVYYPGFLWMLKQHNFLSLIEVYMTSLCYYHKLLF